MLCQYSDVPLYTPCAKKLLRLMKYIFFLSIQVIKETLRRHPPATGNIRKIEKGQDVGGYKIPTDVAIIVQYFCTCLFLQLTTFLKFEANILNRCKTG